MNHTLERERDGAAREGERQRWGERVLTEWEEGETERKIDKGESQER